MMYYAEFLRLEVFNLADAERVVGSTENAKVILNSYVNKGIIKRVRRNLYYTVNLENKEAPADRYLIASKINDSAYLTYHSAFEVHGLSHQISFVVYVASNQRVSDFDFEGFSYKYVRAGIKEGVVSYHLNERIKVTDLERTVVDSLDRLDYCGGPHELDEILKICPVLDEDKLYNYLEAYNKQILYKKAGYFLEQNQQSLGISDDFLAAVEKQTGDTKSYLNEEALDGNGVFINRWGLIVPKTLEIGDDIFV
jgi:predicted transcriptional regulator of viral defense system